MNKWVISLCLMISAVQANASHIVHKHTMTAPAKSMQQQAAEDFTGTWQGTCYDLSLEFIFKQTEKDINLKITEDGELIDSETFTLNQLDTETHSAVLNQSMTKYAQLNINFLNLWMSGVQVMSHGGLEFKSMEFLMIKQGDTLTVRDGEGTVCEFKKAA